MTSSVSKSRSYRDCKATTVEQVPLPWQDDDSKTIQKLVPAVGQLVIKTHSGDIEVDKDGKLRVPATRLRHAEFLGGLNLSQDIRWNLNPYFDERTIKAFGTAFVCEVPNYIVTAYHTIDESAINADESVDKQTYFLFDRVHEREQVRSHGRRINPQEALSSLHQALGEGAAQR